MVGQGKTDSFHFLPAKYIYPQGYQAEKNNVDWQVLFFVVGFFHFKATLKYIAVHAIKKNTKVIFHIKYNTLKQYISSEFIHFNTF